jgi:branched-chain amino acid transport system ATP-binding protein
VTALLSCRDLSVRFGGLTALDRVDLQVSEGEILGLIGPNGSGKTTFFNAVTGIYQASSGSIEFAGGSLTRATPQRVYRAGVARTFQRSRLCLELSIFDNIMIGNHGNLRHALWFNLFHRSALCAEISRNLAEAQELVRAFDPPLATRMFELAGGFPMIDRRRIEICRALVSRPKLLLLDEPSAGMTHEETRQLMNDILAAKARIPGLAIIIIEHEMNVIERVTDRCAVLNFGRKIAEGEYREVAQNKEVQQAYLGTE